MLSKINKWVGRLKSPAGNIAVSFAIAAPALLAGIGLSIDYVMITKKTAELQVVADAAAVASAHELPLANSNKEIIVASAKSFVAANLKTGQAPPPQISPKMSPRMGAAAPATGGSVVSTNVEVVDEFTGVEVTLKEVWKPFFAHFLTDQATPIVVNAKANILGEGLICVVGLMPRTYAGLHMDDRARIDAPDCGIYSNSPIFASIRLDKGSSIKARLVCAFGGVHSFGAGTSIEPRPLSDCPVIKDPLSSRPAPAVGACDYNGLEVGKPVEIPPVSSGDQELVVGFRTKFRRFARSTPVPPPPSYVAAAGFTNRTLKPGVYCGGLFIGQNMNVTFEPGIYVIKDGPFIVTGNAKIKGDGVGFFLTGAESVFDFQADTTIDLVAPRDGALAGLLVFEDRNVPHATRFNPFRLDRLPANMRLHRIRSNNARQLLGTIYTPHAILMIDADSPVADKSAYTAIISWRVWLRDGPSLHLNADYKATDVPVPSSLIGGQIVLSK